MSNPTKAFKRSFEAQMIVACVLGIVIVLAVSRKQPDETGTKDHFSVTEACDDATSLVVKTLVKVSLGFFEVSAYCPCERCCGEFADGRTASGHKIRPGDRFCAADPLLPFEMELDIPGYGLVPVLDRGGAIKGPKLDVFFDTHEKALEWGRQELEIWVWIWAQGDRE